MLVIIGVGGQHSLAFNDWFVIQVAFRTLRLLLEKWSGSETGHAIDQKAAQNNETTRHGNKGTMPFTTGRAALPCL